MTQNSLPVSGVEGLIMARIRTIKPEFWTDEDLSEVSEPACLLALGLLNYADDEGYFNANPKLIKASVFPLREPSVPITVQLRELSDCGYISLFSTSDGKNFGVINNFQKHQVINKPKESKIKELDLLPYEYGSGTVSIPPGMDQGKEQGKEIDHGASAGADDLPQQAQISESESGLNPEQLAVPESGLNPDGPTEPVSGLTPEQVSEPSAGLNPERASGPVPSAEKINYQAILDVYHEVLPEMPRVKILTDDRKKHLRTFWKKYQFDNRKWRSYLGYIATHCRWMLTDRPNGRGGFWKCKNLDYLITERCYVAVKEERANDK